MVRENSRPVPTELTEFLSEIERELTELLPQAADRRPTLEAERERLERQIRGWTQSLGNPELHPAVRTSIEREATQGHQRLLEIEDEVRRKTVCGRSTQEAVDAEAALDRLERLADILQEECPTLANLELSMHMDRIDCHADGRAVMRTCKLGSTPGALDLLSLVVPLEVDEREPPPERRSRRRARLRVDRFDDDADDRLAAADMAADPERFAGLPDEWFWIDEFAPPDGAVACWSVDNANRVKQWSHGLPQLDMYGIEEKLDYWQRHKIDGILLESTDAAGPMGHALWIGSQLMFDLDSDFETLYARYLTDCFGEAAPPLRRMYDRWSRRNQGSGEVAQSLNDLHEASQLVSVGSPPWKRIHELKAYVHYMRLYHEHDGTQASKDRLFEYLYGIHHLMMVQTSAFKHQHYITPLDTGNITPEGTSRRLTPDEIVRNFREDLTAFPLQYEVLTIDFDPAKARLREPAPQTAWRFGGTPHYRLTPKESGTVEFSAGAISSAEFTFYTRDEILIKETVGEKNHSFAESIEDKEWKMKRYSIDVEAGETYQIRLRHGFNRFVMESPLPLFSSQGYEDFDNYAYPDKFFYVPKNATQVVFSDPHPEGLNGKGYLIDPDGKVHKRTPLGAANLFTVPVEPQHRGRVWTARFGRPSWSLRNVPNIVSLMPFDYDE